MVAIKHLTVILTPIIQLWMRVHLVKLPHMKSTHSMEWSCSQSVYL